MVRQHPERGWTQDREIGHGPGVHIPRRYAEVLAADPADHATGSVISTLDNLGNAGVKLISARNNLFVYVHYFTAATPDRSAAQNLLHRQLDALGK